MTNARKRKAIEAVKRLSFDTHGTHAPVAEELYSMAAVAVPSEASKSGPTSA